MNQFISNLPTEFGATLRRRLKALMEARPPSPAPGLLSITLDGGRLRLPESPAPQPGDFYWSRPEREIRWLGRGRAWSARETGPGRLHRLHGAFQRICGHWTRLDPDITGERPRLFTAFAFDPQDPMRDEWRGFANAELVLPELLVQQSGDHCRLTFSCRNGPLDTERQIARWVALVVALFPAPSLHANAPKPWACAGERRQPDNAAWLDLSRRALSAFAGALDKLVLYRRLSLTGSQPLCIGHLLHRVEAAYPDCRLFAAVKQEACLLSASPELLLHKLGKDVRCDALAGSAPRGADPKQDCDLAQNLLADTKNRREHDWVTRALLQSLRPRCDQIRLDHAPAVRRLRTVQHLWNKVRGRLRDDEGLLQIAASLHPTPAVNGSPGDAALAWLRSNGQARRGWYCGAGGWMDAEGNGELAVLLRCALVDGNQLHLYAGAGFVQGSDPATESAEIEWKLQAVMDVLQRTEPGPPAMEQATG